MWSDEGSGRETVECGGDQGQTWSKYKCVAPVPQSSRVMWRCVSLIKDITLRW